MSDPWSKYRADAEYEAWRSGGSMDDLDEERLRDQQREGVPAEHAVEQQLWRDRKPYDE